MEVVVTTGAISCPKLQSNHHHQQTNTQFFTGQMPFLSPNHQCQSTEGKNITFHGLAYPKLTWGLLTLSLTTNSSWLPWGRVAMPLVSLLMPVSRHIFTHLCLGSVWTYSCLVLALSHDCLSSTRTLLMSHTAWQFCEVCCQFMLVKCNQHLTWHSMTVWQ